MSNQEVLEGWVCENQECGEVYAEYVNGCPKCESRVQLQRVDLETREEFFERCRGAGMDMEGAEETTNKHYPKETSNE